MVNFKILFICLFLSSPLFGQAFNPDTFQPIKPVKVEEVKEPISTANSVVDGLLKDINDLLNKVNRLESNLAVLESRVEQLEKDKAEKYTDLTPKEDKKSVKPIKPVEPVGIVEIYSISNCAPCKRWKEDSQGIYKKAFENAGYLVVEGTGAPPASKFPCFVVYKDGIRKWFTGLITPQYVENNM